jgi:multiple sugar transport system substrate-binding protein
MKTGLSRRDFLKASAAASALILADRFSPWAVRRTARAQSQLRFWIGLGATQGDAIVEFVRRATEGTDVSVSVDNFGDDAETKFTAGFGAGDVPNMFETDYPYMGGYVLGLDAFEPLDDILAAVDYPTDSILPVLLDRCRFNGALYAVPHGWNSWVMFYNLDHFEEAGLPTDRDPENLEEFVDWAKRLTKKDNSGRIIRSGFLNTIAQGILPLNIWGVMLHQYGGSIVTEDGRKTNFNNEAGRKAADFVMKTFYEWEVSDPTVSQRYDYWLTGNASMFYTGTWVVSSSLDQQNLNFRTALYPKLGDKMAVQYEYSGLVIPRGSSDEAKLAAARIYKYFAENAGEFGVLSSQLPVTEEGLAYEAYAQSDTHKYFAPSEQGGEFAFWDVAHPQSADFSQYTGNGLLKRILDRVWARQMSIDDALNEADAELQAILDETPAVSLT